MPNATTAPAHTRAMACLDNIGAGESDKRGLAATRRDRCLLLPLAYILDDTL